MIRLAIIPIGMSRCGLRVSSAVVDTASNPMNAKNTSRAAHQPGKTMRHKRVPDGRGFHHECAEGQ